MNPSSLTIKQLEFPYSIPEKNLEELTQDAEFFIDGESLAQGLNIAASRPWFGRTGFLGSDDSVQHFVKELLAEAEATNQFGSKRVVLYRCHCGSDYCGVISCGIVKEQNLLHWLDIREELDEDNAETHLSVKIEKISFDFQQYKEPIMAFLEARVIR